MSGAPDPSTVDNTILKGSDLLAVMRATSSITDWSVLSLLLGIESAEYDRLEKNARALSRNLHKDIIQCWLDSGTASWSSLVKCLCDGMVKKVELAQTISKDHPCSAEPKKDGPPVIGSVEGVLKKSPERRDAHKLLKDESASWYEIGNALGVKRNYREELRRAPDSSDSKLESVLNKWITSECSPVTWENLISALRSIELVEVVRDVIKFLEQPDVRKQYEQKSDWKKI